MAKNENVYNHELKMLRDAVDHAGKKQGLEMINDPSILEIIEIVEEFLRKKERVCYGGTAINNILPLQDQFYDKTSQFPDYDFFSPNALDDAKKLADIYHKRGFKTVEAKAGMHHGTYKVYVNFIPVADITFLVPEIYESVFNSAKKVGGIYYAPPDLLRMGMYLELSRPMGDTSRWEKVLKRLNLLTKHFPLEGKGCEKINVQRLFGKKSGKGDKIFETVKESLIAQDVVFFGAFANRMYLKHLKKFKKKNIHKIPDFDVLSTNPKKTAEILKERLEENNFKNISIESREGVGEIIAPHYEVKIGKETVAFIYEPLGCHNYNIITLGNFNIRIATIDTMLSFYLAFLFIDRPYYDPQRILCMSKYLFDVQRENIKKNEGILKRFSVDCYGTQPTMASIRSDKNKVHELLQSKKGTRQWDEHFLKYDPNNKKGTLKKKGKQKVKKRKTRRVKRKTKRRKTKKRKN